MFCAAFYQCSSARWNRQNAALKAFAYVFNKIRYFHRDQGDIGVHERPPPPFGIKRARSTCWQFLMPKPAAKNLPAKSEVAPVGANA
jgi:hypothetical protein